MTTAKKKAESVKSSPTLQNEHGESKYWLISQSELDAWLNSIADAKTLIAPVEEANVVLYKHIQTCKQIAPEFIRPLLSVKGVFFPPSESMFTIRKTGQEISLEERFSQDEVVVFGVRPCGASGAKILDALFLDTEPVDLFYSRRRENTTLIGLACQEMGPDCFCTSVGEAPDDGSDMDIMLHAVDQGYLVQAVTEKGQRLIPCSEWGETELRHTPQTYESNYPIPDKEKWPRHFIDEFWARIGERCLSCRACAYVCPTCRCFVVRDEVVAPGEFERLRCWDSCMGENYRRVAGGHKPRSKKGERQRNRFFCKFYYFPEQYTLETSACTGCGRCIEVCPVGVDVTEILIQMEEAA